MVRIMTCLLELEGIGKVIQDPCCWLARLNVIVLSLPKKFRVTTKISSTFQGAAKEKATEIFQYLDVNSDGRVELQEFVNGFLKNKELVGMLKKKSETPKSMKPPDVCVVLVQDDNNSEVS